MDGPGIEQVNHAPHHAHLLSRDAQTQTLALHPSLSRMANELEM